MPQYLIGILGRKGSGKSTLARQLLASHPNTVIIPIAWGIKAGLEAMGVPHNVLHDPDLKSRPNKLLQDKTPRHAMVTLGTEWGRNMIGENFWLDVWMNKVLSTPSDQTVLADDVRFENEIKLIRVLGGKVVAIKRPGEPEPPKWWEIHKPKWHPSESLRYEDYGIPVIMNDGTPEQLLEKFRAAVGQSGA